MSVLFAASTQTFSEQGIRLQIQWAAKATDDRSESWSRGRSWRPGTGRPLDGQDESARTLSRTLAPGTGREEGKKRAYRREGGGDRRCSMGSGRRSLVPRRRLPSVVPRRRLSSRRTGFVPDLWGSGFVPGGGGGKMARIDRVLFRAESSRTTILGPAWIETGPIRSGWNRPGSGPIRPNRTRPKQELGLHQR